jgi:hypothetical protein
LEPFPAQAGPLTDILASLQHALGDTFRLERELRAEREALLRESTDR